ncbi:Polar amino acid ABC transporter, inner membrane subunit [uncultured delta proteobacterium]|uniref:Polar amino acid ABC transporter, inner membrane subunit n=1 Tax=uncultured delta proteobacterium TaxID=34034 RepID=A0A212K3N5_9DELT|nr:Polar amino acid ABC transporter, inner membrane subunit [uncultured delta proteobacterium]
MNVDFDLTFYTERVIPALNAGLTVSLKLILPSAVLGFIFGILLGALRVYAPRPVRRLGDSFTALVRGVPLVVQLVFIYNCFPKIGNALDGVLYGSFPGLGAAVDKTLVFLTGPLPESLHYGGELFRTLLVYDAFGSAVLGFIICSAAYQSEYVRGALFSIRQGQIKAAQALGFSTPKMLFSIILPQAVRRALPGCGNEIIYLIKYSSLAYVISCIELTGEANVLAGRSYRYIEVYLAAGCYYLAMTSFATLLLNYCERRFAIPGFGRGN